MQNIYAKICSLCRVYILQDMLRRTGTLLMALHLSPAGGGRAVAAWPQCRAWTQTRDRASGLRPGQ